jgi:hypothetical protein
LAFARRVEIIIRRMLQRYVIAKRNCVALGLWISVGNVTKNDREKMKLPLYVCVTCPQSFTRRSSARRHNFNLHFNQGIIVQMLEYIIGRFLPPNQLSNRRFRRPIFIKSEDG